MNTMKKKLQNSSIAGVRTNDTGADMATGRIGMANPNKGASENSIGLANPNKGIDTSSTGPATPDKGLHTDGFTASARPTLPENNGSLNPSRINQSYYTQPSNATNYEQNKPVYTQSDALLAAGQAVADAEQNKPGEYRSSYHDQIQGMIDSILNQKPFQYDAAADPLYQQYAQQYQRNGELAMRDAMAQTSALTGGYGNTYAQLAGQQGYQRYMEDLNAMLPQLQQAAYQMYQDEGSTMRSNLAMLQGADQVDYGCYRDSVGDWQNELNYLYGKYSNMSQDEYNRYLNDRQSWENDRAYWYQQSQDQANQSWQQQQFEYQQAQDQANWDWQQQQFAYQQQQDQMNWDWMREQFEYQKQQDELARKKSSGGGSRKPETKADWAGILNVPNVSTLGAAVGGLTAYGGNLAATTELLKKHKPSS